MGNQAFLYDENLEEKLREIRAERYALQSVAKKALPSERVSICLRNVLDKTEGVDIYRHRETSKAFYAKLAVCASVWTCPVCASKISERRREELKKIFNAHLNEGGKVALLTLTFAHSNNDRLDDLLDKFSKATKRFFSGKVYHEIREKMGMVGSVRALEVTYGMSSGFHPHIHSILFYFNDVDIRKIQTELRKKWQKDCQKEGLRVLQRIGLTLQDAEKAHNYLNKQGNWGLDRELTKGHMKKGKTYERMTPFDLLKKYLETESDFFLNVFREYAKAIKGKRQLFYSNGMKKRYNIVDKTDEELAKENIEKADFLANIDYLTWKKVLEKDYRALLLDLVEKYGVNEALNILGLKNRLI